MTPFVASLLVAFTLLPRPTLGRPITPPMLDARQNISTQMELIFNIVFSLGEVKLLYIFTTSHSPPSQALLVAIFGSFVWLATERTLAQLVESLKRGW